MCVNALNQGVERYAGIVQNRTLTDNQKTKRSGERGERETGLTGLTTEHNQKSLDQPGHLTITLLVNDSEDHDKAERPPTIRFQSKTLIS